MNEQYDSIEALIDELKLQRDHARGLARSFYEVMVEFPTDIEDFGIDPSSKSPGDGWYAAQSPKRT